MTHPKSPMDSSSNEVTHDFRPFFRVYKDGRIERFDTPYVPPSTDPITGVQSKDVVVSPEPKVSARIYLPKITSNRQKIPLLIYYHGGAFSSESAFSTLYHNYLNSLVSTVHVIAVSIEYRIAPENPVPACYVDSWTALKWVALHAQNGPDPWINDHANFNRVFLMGDSSGGNIAHNMGVQAGTEGLGTGVKIVGMVLIHPLFGNNEHHDKMWNYICPETIGAEDPKYNPGSDPSSLAKIVCEKVLITTASKDRLRERGWIYYRALKSSEWRGVVEIVETVKEKHVFHLFKNNSEKARSLMKLVASFINQNHLATSSL